MKRVFSVFMGLFLLLTGCTHAPVPGCNMVRGEGPAALPIAPPPVAAAPEAAPSSPPEVETPTPEEQVAALLAKMTVEEKVGQLFLARFPGDGAEVDAQTYHLGGYMLFARDFQNSTPDETRHRLAGLQEQAAIPLLLAVDEEGGSVVRVSGNSAFRARPFQSPQRVYAQGGLEALEQDAAEKSRFLLDLGLNVNLAPVCDVSTRPGDYIYPRTLGKDGAETAEYIRRVVAAMGAEGIGAVLKHFPGYGGNRDTHAGASADQRTLAELESSDLLPFQAGIKAGAGGVLVSHNIVAALDPGHPASLSPAVYAYLRELGFQGVAITDDLVMGAIKADYSPGEAAVAAVAAGGDLLCSSQYPLQYEAVLQGVQSGEISLQRLEEAAGRVLLWKYQLGMLDEYFG